MANNQNSERAELQEALRNLPAVDQLLKQPAVGNLLDEFPRAELITALRAVLDERRAALRRGETPVTDVPALALDVRQMLHQRARPSLRRVINATGVVLHTNLGRAPLAQDIVAAIVDVMGGYSTLEFDIETGRRGDRQAHVRTLLRELTGAEDGLIVNNNAAATFLVLNTLGAEREVVVSRGQLVEIGGSYRMPEVMAAARCRMVEVGTTNRTHLRDYERAIGENTAALIHVHTSNYRIQGFVASPTLAELVELGHRHHLLVFDDLGSGLLAKDVPWPVGENEAGDVITAVTSDGAPEPERRGSRVDEDDQAGEYPPPVGRWDEPSVRESIAAGADLTFFSGDKLLGGPQAGVVVGRADLIGHLRGNPLMRTLRPDKMALAGMEATLRLYRDPETLYRRLPVYRYLSRTPAMLRGLAARLRGEIARLLPDAEVTARVDHSYAGGGALPTLEFPTWVVRVRCRSMPAEHIVAGLRRRDVPIIGRVQDEALLFDCRALADDEVEQIAPALADVVRELAELG
ncbi:MAG: L-seryl-tRNA(Sec) selenium transferase [Planctomycetes bacterium]|nr:L-seryl-tRNA(Sec) selenium transferase [Planctomycetota bacterium]